MLSEVKLSKLNGMEKFSIDLKNDGMLLKNILIIFNALRKKA